MRHEIDRRTICGEDIVRCEAFDKIYKKVERGMFVFVYRVTELLIISFQSPFSLPKTENLRDDDDRKRNLEKTQNLEVIIV